MVNERMQGDRPTSEWRDGTVQPIASRSVLHLKYQLANLIALKRCRSGIEVQISTQFPRVGQSKEKERYGTAALCLVGLLFFRTNARYRCNISC